MSVSMPQEVKPKRQSPVFGLTKEEYAQRRAARKKRRQERLKKENPGKSALCANGHCEGALQYSKQCTGHCKGHLCTCSCHSSTRAKQQETNAELLQEFLKLSRTVDPKAEFPVIRFYPPPSSHHQAWSLQKKVEWLRAHQQVGLSDFDRKVVHSGDVYFYSMKAPFTESGFSIAGGLEYDEAEDKIKCHECGGWFRSVARHCHAHGLTAAEYKKKHILNDSTALICEGTREKKIALGKTHVDHLYKARAKGHATLKASNYAAFKKRKKGWKLETRNSKKQCPEQLLEQIRDLEKRLGHTPSELEMKEDGITGHSVRYTFGSYTEATRLAGLAPNAQSLKGEPRISKEQMAAMLKTFYDQHGRLPSRSDARRGLIPVSYTTFYRHFGSLTKFGHKAGMRLPQTQVTRRLLTPAKAIVLLKKAIIANGGVPLSSDKKFFVLNDLPRLTWFINTFGSWGKAVKLAGFSAVGRGKCLPGKKRKRTDLLSTEEGLRRLKIAIEEDGVPRTQDTAFFKKHKLPTAMWFHYRCGSWSKALVAIGVTPNRKPPVKK